MDKTVDLPKSMHDFVVSAIGEKGIEIPHALLLNRKGELTMMALMLDEPTQAYAAVLNTILKDDAVEAIFGLDRFTKPGQGTKYQDVFGGHYYKRDLNSDKSIFDPGFFKPFIIEYQIEPRIVDPIVWDNPFWNQGLKGELESMMAHMRIKMNTMGGCIYCGKHGGDHESFCYGAPIRPIDDLFQ